MMANGLATALTLLASLVGCGGGGGGLGTCSQGGKTYQVGATFKDSDGCNTCECRTDGIACTLMACLRDGGSPQADAPAAPEVGPDTGGDTTPPADSAGAIDGAGQSTNRDPTKVQSVSLTAAQVFMEPTAPFLLRAELARGADGLFDLAANLQVSVSGCTGDACTRQVTMRLSREQTARVEGWLAVVPGEACHDDPGPICDFGIHYAIGINGPPQNQTCCKLYEWGQNMDVTTLHSYLQDLAVALINPVQANPG
jgi:hypothetical protein